jgi:hypothetical protein
MFYIGGAGKKKTLREIFKVSKDADAAVEDEGEGEEDVGKRARSQSRSRSRSRSRMSNTTNDDNDETDSESDNHDTDTDAESTQEADHNENHDYIATIGSNTTDGFHHRYKFVEDELEYDIEEFVEQNPKVKQYEFVIYRINTKCDTPFLEFLFYCENSVCKLPYYNHAPKKHIRKECDNVMSQLFTSKYRYRGYLHDEITGKCFLFYEKYFRQQNIQPVKLSLQKSHNWYWVCTTEILHQKRYMTIPIQEGAVDLFVAYPTIGLLHATIPNSDTRVRPHGTPKSRNERFQTACIEAPAILYYGSTLCYTETTALYGLKREPLISRFGPFYYFTSLEHSYYWACYRNTSKHNSKERNTEGGISRYAVFTRRMKTTFQDDDYDVEMVKKFVERKNIFETKINEYRHTQEVYQPGMYDSIYSYDYSWTTDFDTIYNGYYDKSKIVRPVWCVSDHGNFQQLSYYAVDTEKIPNTYDPEYTDYTIL